MSQKDSYQRICQKLAAMDEGDVYPQMDGGFVRLCFFCKGERGQHKPKCIYQRAYQRNCFLKNGVRQGKMSKFTEPTYIFTQEIKRIAENKQWKTQ